MQRTMKVFVIPPDRAPGGPPEPARQMVVEARTTDGLREAAREKLAGEGLRVRSLSLGPKGIVAYVEAER
ncbi:MAG: hypothetical protein KC583_01385 [Myxococcales bacterium]|nr:hypothetical protein [Myxococcales bacterium]